MVILLHYFYTDFCSSVYQVGIICRIDSYYVLMYVGQFAFVLLYFRGRTMFGIMIFPMACLCFLSVMIIEMHIKTFC